MAKKEFKAESKRLLELMIHSIYTNKEIFLRELISNASDATDKRYYQNAQAGGEALNRNELPITIAVDKDSRTLVIEDHGCGMNKKELEDNLGIIAKSGSHDFKNNMEKTDEIDIIGQFGVGFYSAFMVADKVEVVSKPAEGGAHYWVSEGIDGYSVNPCEKDDIGTKIILTIKNDTAEDKYEEFLDSYYIRTLVRKHSDYIRYPIQMEIEKTRDKDGEEGEKETYSETETLNSMTPIWKKKKSEVTDEEYNNFYKNKFFDYADPAKVIYTSTEGVATYDALLFIPEHAPMNYHSKEYQKGLQLYASGVLIMEHCADLLPDYFGFVRGVVDSQDLSLNISREMLQQDRQLSFIAGRIEKKIQSELLLMQKNEPDKYKAVFKNFGTAIKYGIYESYGAKKDFLQDLIVFESSASDITTLKSYVQRMPEEQKYIYYVSGENIEQLKNLPATETVREKGFELLYFTNQIDEFTIKIMRDFDGKEFRSITGGDLGLESDEEKKELEKQAEDSKALLEFMKETLGDKVAEVSVSNRLKKHPVCLTTKGDLTLEMERVLSSMQQGDMPVKAQRVLEINPEHAVFKKLGELYEADKEKLKAYTSILYNQSLLLEGLPIDDPVAFSEAVSELMV